MDDREPKEPLPRMHDTVIPKAPERSFLARLRGYLIAGILVTAPLTITVYLTISIINFIDFRVVRLIPPQYNPNEYLPFSVPGLGVILMVLFLIGVGMLTANFFGRFFVRMSEYFLDRMPIVRSLYGATKQIFETVLAHQSQAFREVVLIEYPRKGIWVIGFITGPTKGQIQDLTEQETVNVFLPTTPNPTSGFLLFVPREDVYFLDMTVEEGLKLVVSAGIINPPERGKKAIKGTAKGTAKGKVPVNDSSNKPDASPEA